MKSYFLYRGGKKYGPYTDVQLKRAASIGKLKHDDLLSDGPEGKRTPVSSMAEFSEWFGAGLPDFKATPAEKPAPVNPFPESMTRHKAHGDANCQPVQPSGEIDTGALIEAAFGILMGIVSLAMAAWWAVLAFSL